MLDELGELFAAPPVAAVPPQEEPRQILSELAAALRQKAEHEDADMRAGTEAHEMPAGISRVARVGREEIQNALASPVSELSSLRHLETQAVAVVPPRDQKEDDQARVEPLKAGVVGQDLPQRGQLASVTGATTSVGGNGYWCPHCGCAGYHSANCSYDQFKPGVAAVPPQEEASEKLEGVWISNDPRDNGRRVRVVGVQRGKVAYRNEETTRLAYAHLPNFLSMFTKVDPPSSTTARAAAPSIDPDVVLCLASELEATFDPGGNLPDDCEEWATRHMDVIHKLRGLAECALMGEDDND